MLRERQGALSWLLCFQFFIAEQIARVHVRGPYTLTCNAISDLGSIRGFRVGAAAISDSPLHLLMNASFTLQGLLIASGAILLRRLFPAVTLTRAALGMLTFAALGVFVVGLIPEDANLQAHILAAGMHFFCGSMAMVLFGCAVLKASWRAGYASIAAGAIGLGATVLLAMRHTALWAELGLQPGLVERFAAYPLPIWLTITGFVLLTQSRTDTSTPLQTSCAARTQ